MIKTNISQIKILGGRIDKNETKIEKLKKEIKDINGITNQNYIKKKMNQI